MKQACHGSDALRDPESSVGVIPVIPRTKYTFHGSTAGVPPPPSIIPLRTRIDTSEWTSGVLIVRLHAKSFPSATSAAEVEVYNDAFTPEDPAQTFVESLLRGIATIPNGAAVGTLYAVDLVQPFASMVRVQLKFYQGTSTSGVSSLTLSAVLVGRKRRNFDEEPENDGDFADDGIREHDEGSLVVDFMALIAADYRISSACAHALNVTRGTVPHPSSHLTRRRDQSDRRVGTRIGTKSTALRACEACSNDATDGARRR